MIAASTCPRVCVPIRHAPGTPSVRNERAIGENPANHPAGIEALRFPDRQFAALITAKRWSPGKVLTIAFRGGRVIDRKAILAAGREWMKFANIRFAEVGQGQPSILRCQFWDASDDVGSWSFIGTDALAAGPKEPTINIGWPDDPGRDLHELGHALGLIHEHQNPLAKIPWNTSAVYSYYTGPPNYWTPEDVRVQVLENETEPLTNGGFDKQSIMLYPIPVALVTDPKFAVGFNEVLSAGDKAFVGKVYPPTAKPKPPVKPPVKPDPSTPKVPTMDGLNEQVAKLIQGLTSSLGPDHPLDLQKLVQVLAGSFATGGHVALWPALKGNLDTLITDPEIKKDVAAVLKAINDPTAENEIAAVLEIANSPMTKEIAKVLFDALAGSLKITHAA